MEFYNLFYGECKIIDSTEDLYLVEVSKNWARFIVCRYIYADGSMTGQEFFKTLEDAQDYFNNIKKGMSRK